LGSAADFEDDEDYELPYELQVPSSRGLFELVDDWHEEEYVSDRDIDNLAKEMAWMMAYTGSFNETIEYFSALSDEVKAPRGVYLRRSKNPKDRPKRKKSENFCLTGYVEINGQKAFALFDSGCTTEACSPDFARVAGIKVFPIKSEVILQLGTAGSRSKINHGMKATVKYASIESEEYLDIVNLDKFDVIIGTKFMRKHKMQLDFQFDTVRVRGVAAPTLSATEEVSEVEHRSAARKLSKDD
jgi:hypothetical protein